MQIDNATLSALRTGFKAQYQGAFDAMRAETQYKNICTYVPSTDKKETYGWLRDDAKMRKWLGPRHVQSVVANAHVVENDPFEYTIGVNRYDILFDKLGTYAPRFNNMGRAAAQNPELLAWALLKEGFTRNCWDGQYFFDTDHPLYFSDGSTGTFANTDGGSGAPWFLIDTKKGLLPLVHQQAIAPNFVSRDNPQDPRVFDLNEYSYGVDSYENCGFSLPQLAWGSKQTLNHENYATARAGLGNIKGDGGQAAGIFGDLLVVGPSNEGRGRKIVISENTTGGDSNEWKGTARLLVVPWLP